ncbi:Gfo/Idh/MocA family oxidoreductase [Larkinella knui]|uniref:Gfo/Idh/MocA family oxidoreductase n=1 Tax=Larkinella knui TaxID=2025310 RepID=A0A3P1CW82_9BACT|nr:Gfo/Idh/MocA family oxidoreductase [Larkinella knui]RRB17448.1 gfo/Idh/MocA family oxidoreductase [Larkinella knui]
MTDRKVKIAIIGLGKMGISHLAILNAHPALEVVGVCDTSGIVMEALKQHSAFECFADYKKMVDKVRPEAVLIATPTKLHFEMARFALERGLHVFMEKPFTLNMSQGEELVRLAEARNLVTQVGYHNRFIGVFNEVKRLVDLGALGDVYHFVAESYGPVVTRKKEDTWRSNPSEGGGCLLDYTSHVVDLLQFVLGRVDKVDGSTLKKIYSSSVEDAVYSTLHLDSGISGFLSVNWSDETYRKMSTQLTIIGMSGKLVADAQEMKVYFKTAPAIAGYEKGWNVKYITDLTPGVDFYLRGEEYSAQIDYFARCIQNRNAHGISTFRSALETDRVLNLLRTYPQ